MVALAMARSSLPWLALLGLALACSDDLRTGGGHNDETQGDETSGDESEPLLGDAELAFVAPFDGVDQIWLMRANGSDRRPLSTDGGPKRWPTWSPDGEVLAFVEQLPFEPCLQPSTLIIATDDQRTPLATLDHMVRELAFDASKDGLFVVVDGCGESFREATLHWYPLDGGEPELLDSFDDLPSIDASPQPGRYAISVGRFYPNPDSANGMGYDFPDVLIASRSADEPTRIIDFHAYDTEVDWHPDGERLAFQTDLDSGLAVYSVAVDGGDLRRESPVGVFEFDPEWSPDGEILLTLRLGSGSLDDATILRSADDERVLAGVRASRWSPDQSALLVHSSKLVGKHVVKLDLASEAQIDLGPGWSATWRPID